MIEYDPSKLPKMSGESALTFNIGEEALSGEYEILWVGSCYKITKK